MIRRLWFFLTLHRLSFLGTWTVASVTMWIIFAVFGGRAWWLTEQMAVQIAQGPQDFQSLKRDLKRTQGESDHWRERALGAESQIFDLIYQHKNDGETIKGMEKVLRGEG